MAEPGLEGLHALLALLPALYVPADAEHFPQRLVKIIEQLLPTDLVGFTDADLLRDRATGAVSEADFDMTRWMPVFDAHVGEHPLIKHFQQNPDDPRVLRFSDVIAPSDFQRTGIYNEFFLPLGRPYQMGFTVRASPRRVIGVGISRRGPDFSDAECRLLAALRPHVLRAYQNAKALTHQRKVLEACRHALDESGIGVAVQNGRVLWITEPAQRLLFKYFPGVHRGTALPDALRHWLARRRPGHSAAEDGVAVPPLIVRHQDDQLCVRLLPGRSAGEILLRFEEQLGSSPRRLQSLGLTAREGEVAAWLARGKSNPEIAVIVGLNVRTVEKHLEHIYARLGVENRLAATLHILQHLGSGGGSSD